MEYLLCLKDPLSITVIVATLRTNEIPATINVLSGKKGRDWLRLNTEKELPEKIYQFLTNYGLD